MIILIIGRIIGQKGRLTKSKARIVDMGMGNKRGRVVSPISWIHYPSQSHSIPRLFNHPIPSLPFHSWSIPPFVLFALFGRSKKENDKLVYCDGSSCLHFRLNVNVALGVQNGWKKSRKGEGWISTKKNGEDTRQGWIGRGYGDTVDEEELIDCSFLTTVGRGWRMKPVWYSV